MEPVYPLEKQKKPKCTLLDESIEEKRDGLKTLLMAWDPQYRMVMKKLEKEQEDSPEEKKVEQKWRVRTCRG